MLVICPRSLVWGFFVCLFFRVFFSPVSWISGFGSETWREAPRQQLCSSSSLESSQCYWRREGRVPRGWAPGKNGTDGLYLRVASGFWCRVWEKCSTGGCIDKEADFKMRQVLTLEKGKPRVFLKMTKSCKIKRKNMSHCPDLSNIGIIVMQMPYILSIKLCWTNSRRRSGVRSNVKFHFPY